MALGKNVRRLREAHEWRLEDLALRSGVDVGTISALELRDSQRSKYAGQLARALGVSLEALVESTPSQAGESASIGALEAQILSHQFPIVIPQIKWESLVELPLPPRFEVQLVDDSMAPRVKKGQPVTFETGLTPSAGDGVLIQDAAGGIYFRIYRARTAAEWDAYPVNDSYQPLNSVRDGLRVLAVLVGVPARWS